MPVIALAFHDNGFTRDTRDTATVLPMFSPALQLYIPFA